MHKFLKEFQERIDLFKPNTALSAFMEFLNDCNENSYKLSRASVEKVLVVLSTMAPYMASELLEELLVKKITRLFVANL